MKKIFILILLSFAGFVSGFLFFRFTSNDKLQRQKEFNDRYAVFAIDLPSALSFAGEKIPLNDPDVHERLDKEMLVNVYWQSQTLLLIKRAARWFPVIEPILKKNGVPDDFKYLALAESGLTNVVSPSGAAGFWQFLESTGKKYNLEVNTEVDERYHLEKSTQAACDYFKEAYVEFSSWSTVAASYNMGIDGVKRQLEKQKEKNYFDLVLNEETSRYVFRIISLKEIISNPLRYGFHYRNRDLYAAIPYKTVTVDSAVTDFADFARTNGVNYKQLKLANPWLRQGFLSNKSGKSYEIKIPDATFDYQRYWEKDSM